MITGDIKNRIDSIWDTYWVGGITNPMSVLEQMTYLFFMKMIDDAQLKKEAEANILGVRIANPTFKDGMWHNPETDNDVPYNSLRWHVFKNMEATQMFNTIRNDAFSFIKNLSEGKSSAYSRFMRDAVFLIQNPRTLTKIVDGVDSLDMGNRDAMGDVYEYILGKMAASGTNGQFRTPRHIREMMVNIIEPTPDDLICDPACGTAGFLVSSSSFIREKYEDTMTEEQWNRFSGEAYTGFDTDPTMLRISAMNLMLHSITHPHIEYKDSVSKANDIIGKFDVCLANPPFKGSIDAESIHGNLTNVVKTKKTELLFLALFIRMLRTGGRCACIVPDGVLFGSSKAHKSIRKELIENHQLRAVISMPSGVFKPYAGVSTAVLVFTKTNTGGTDQVWFYDMKADGFSLDDKRSEIKENDIPDIIARYHNLGNEAKRERTDQSFLVPKSEIVENEYDLSINKYKKTVYKAVEYHANRTGTENTRTFTNRYNHALCNCESE